MLSFYMHCTNKTRESASSTTAYIFMHNFFQLIRIFSILIISLNTLPFHHSLGFLITIKSFLFTFSIPCSFPNSQFNISSYKPLSFIMFLLWSIHFLFQLSFFTISHYLHSTLLISKMMNLIRYWLFLLFN